MRKMRYILVIAALGLTACSTKEVQAVHLKADTTYVISSTDGYVCSGLRNPAPIKGTKVRCAWTAR